MNKITTHTSETVINGVNDFIVRLGLGIIDAIIHYCEQYDLEIEFVAKIIRSDRVLRERLEEEATALNMLKITKNSGNTLPV